MAGELERKKFRDDGRRRHHDWVGHGEILRGTYRRQQAKIM
jgi:hypothetical protein